MYKHLRAAAGVSAGVMAWLACNACPAAVPPSGAGLDRAAILKELGDFSLEGMSRRLGPDYASYHKQGAEEKFPEVWMPPAKQDPGGRPYQIGGPWTKAGGDFSSTQGQVLFVPDRGVFPVDRVTIIEWSNGCFTEAPLPPWHGGFRPEPASKKWIQAAPGGETGVPIGMARGMGYWARPQAVAVYVRGRPGVEAAGREGRGRAAAHGRNRQPGRRGQGAGARRLGGREGGRVHRRRPGDG